MYHVAVILTDIEKKILWVNDDFTAITGYGIDEVVGKTPGSILQGPSSEAEAIKRIRHGLSSLVSVKEQITNYRKNGEPYLCKLVIHPIFNNMQKLTNYIAFEVDGSVVKDDSNIPLLQLKNKYQTSSLRGVDEMKLFVKIKNIIQEEKLFLDPNLSLKKLADRLNTNTKYLSQVVNHCSGHNFQHFINTYRIKAIEELIREGQHHHLTLFGLAQQCGFKNKSTFYKVFKDLKGKTPNAYLKSQLRGQTDA